MNKITTTISFIFYAVFVAAISVVACHFSNAGLLWWYLLPTFGALISTIVATEGRADGK